MEFYHKTPHEDLDVARLQHLLGLDKLPALCASIDSVALNNDRAGSLYCLWGAFDVERVDVRCGTRFSLLDCPHALAWTITYDRQNQDLIVHCSVDKTELDPEFAESIQSFVDDWADGLEKALA